MAMQQFAVLEQMIGERLRTHPDQAWAAGLQRRLRGCRGGDPVSRASCIGDVFNRLISRECGFAPDLRLTESRVRVVAGRTGLPADMVRSMRDDPVAGRMFAIAAVLWSEGCRANGSARGFGSSPGSAGSASPPGLEPPSEPLRRLMEDHERSMRQERAPSPPQRRRPEEPTVVDELLDLIGASAAAHSCRSRALMTSSQRAAQELVLCLWGSHPGYGPAISRRIGNVTPELGAFALRIFACHEGAHDLMRALEAALRHPRPWHTWRRVPRWFAAEAARYALARGDWGLAVRASAATYARGVAAYLANPRNDFGDPDHPLPGYSCGRIGG